MEPRFTKDPEFYRCFNADDSAFGAIDPEVSRIRRTMMHTFFSKQAVLGFEDKIRSKVIVLTFVVGASIVVSLVGRGQIADKINRLPSPADRVRRLKDLQFEAAEEEEKYMQQKRAEEEDGDGDEDSADDDE